MPGPLAKLNGEQPCEPRPATSQAIRHHVSGQCRIRHSNQQTYTDGVPELCLPPNDGDGEAAPTGTCCQKRVQFRLGAEPSEINWGVSGLAMGKKANGGGRCRGRKVNGSTGLCLLRGFTYASLRRMKAVDDAIHQDIAAFVHAFDGNDETSSLRITRSSGLGKLALVSAVLEP